jgi:putative FmdB family regulatory protein
MPAARPRFLELAMPTYEYACTECGEHVEVVQSMSDAPLVTCPVCGGRLRKVFAPIGVVFKGSGFYRTDSRAKPAAAETKAGKGAQNGKAATDAKTPSSTESSTPSKKTTEKSA